MYANKCKTEEDKTSSTIDVYDADKHILICPAVRHFSNSMAVYFHTSYCSKYNFVLAHFNIGK